MTRTSKLLSAASAIALVALSATPAMADGTDAGTPIENTVSVSYQVGGAQQDDQVATDEFLVDRRVNLTVAELNGAATSVAPGSNNQVVSFTVTNTSNDTLDFGLTVNQQIGGAAKFGGLNDTFNSGAVTIYVDTDGDGDWTDEVATTYIDELPADESRTVFLVANIPLNDGTDPLTTDDVATLVLTAQAFAGDNIGTQGALLTNSATNDPAVIDTVLADGAGATDAANDGAFSDRDDYIVSAADLTVTKKSVVISDGVTAAGGVQKAIPGAVIEYCIAVSNASGSATATDIEISDILPANMEYVDPSIRVNATLDGDGNCVSASGTAGGNFDGTTVTGSLNDIAAGETLALLFRATID